MVRAHRYRAPSSARKHQRRWDPHEEIRCALKELPVAGWFFRGHQGKFSYHRLVGVLFAIPLVVTLGWIAISSARSSDGVKVAEQAVKPTLREAEQVLDHFLRADHWEGQVAYVRNPAQTRPLMEEWHKRYPYVPISAYTVVDAREGLIGAADGSAVSDRWVAMFKVLLPDEGQGRVMNVELTPQGFKVDWETAVIYHEMPLDQFMETAPKEEVVFRLNVGEGAYYNYAFEDETLWKSFGFVDPTGMHAIHGYAKRGSAMERQLSGFMMGEEFTPVMVGLQMANPDQDVALITSVVQKGWLRDPITKGE